MPTIHRDETQFAGPVKLGTAYMYELSVTPGAEASDAIDVVCQVTGLDGNAVSTTVQVAIRTLAVTDNKGDLAAASAAVGTVKKVVNPATGSNELWMQSTSGGAFSFKVSNDVAEDTLYEIHATNCRPVIGKLTFA